MKKLILSLVALAAISLNAGAQTWKMFVNHQDGTVDTIKTSAVKNVTFTPEDQNADQVIIKELYNGGCPKNDGSGYIPYDKGLVLYNNCSKTAVVSNLAVAFATPYNANGTSGWRDDSGNLSYASEGFIPANDGIWYFQSPLVLKPYSQVVISINGAIDNTQTYTQSVNYANANYYAMYDPESGYTNTSYYPTPSDVIPTSHYLKAVRLGQGNAWALSVSAPALFIFQTQDVTPAVFANNVNNITYEPGKPQTNVYKNLKVPNQWIIDGVEVYPATNISSSKKRFTSDIDGGYVAFTSQLGYTLYRNVDKESTEALSENSGKLVYNYSLGVGTSTDPSGIDAEASIKKGAHIIYQDTNNSTNDFHERQKFSIRGE
jgi:hypothetical protein